MSKKIAAFGEVVMRLEVPQYNMLSQTNTLAYSFSGTGVNVLGALAKLGHEVYLVSSLPNNPLGNAAAELYESWVYPQHILLKLVIIYECIF